MSKLSRDKVAQEIDEKHDLRIAVRRLKIADADSLQLSRTALIDAVLSLPGVSSDPVTVSDVTVLIDTFTGVCPSLSVRAVLPDPVPGVLRPLMGGQDTEGLSPG